MLPAKDSKESLEKNREKDFEDAHAEEKPSWKKNKRFK